jgi:hypothetical protein
MGAVKAVFYLRTLINLSSYLLTLFFRPKRIKFDTRNMYITVLRLREFRKTLYSEIISLLGGRK